MSAARGHELNDAYMGEFEKGYESLYGESCAADPLRNEVITV